MTQRKYPDWMFHEEGVDYAVIEYADGSIRREEVSTSADIQKGATKRAVESKKKPCGCGKNKTQEIGSQAVEPQRLGLRDIAHGAVGKAKSVLGVGIAPASDISLRQALCQPCGYRNMDKCGICHCPIKDKTRLASESCPAGYWEATQKVVEGEVFDKN